MPSRLFPAPGKGLGCGPVRVWPIPLPEAQASLSGASLPHGAFSPRGSPLFLLPAPSHSGSCQGWGLSPSFSPSSLSCSGLSYTSPPAGCEPVEGSRTAGCLQPVQGWPEEHLGGQSNPSIRAGLQAPSRDCMGSVGYADGSFGLNLPPSAPGTPTTFCIWQPP